MHLKNLAYILSCKVVSVGQYFPFCFLSALFSRIDKTKMRGVEGFVKDKNSVRTKFLFEPIDELHFYE